MPVRESNGIKGNVAYKLSFRKREAVLLPIARIGSLPSKDKLFLSNSMKRSFMNDETLRSTASQVQGLREIRTPKEINKYDEAKS